VSFEKFTRIALSILIVLGGTGSVFSQSGPTRVTVVQTSRPSNALVSGSNLYCAGYIQASSISTANRIIGAQDEADKYNYSQNDFLYINMGNNKGVSVGDTFTIVRPRGQVKSAWTKKDDIGFYVQEVGALEVVDVKSEVAVARVKTSCDTILLGDLVQLVPNRISPPIEVRPPLNRFGDPSGKATGRILMARDGVETLAKNFIAYVDLGADNNVNVGDRLTVFRPLGKGNLFTKPEDEVGSARDYGFESDVYKGGRFSNQAPRKEGEFARGDEVTTGKAKKGRPDHLRKVVGEAVVLNVKEKTATIVITRTGQEIHTGDWVEIQ
jgi:hypothetical protein